VNRNFVTDWVGACPENWQAVSINSMMQAIDFKRTMGSPLHGKCKTAVICFSTPEYSRTAASSEDAAVVNV
jgi:hypothetical protein